MAVSQEPVGVHQRVRGQGDRLGQLGQEWPVRVQLGAHADQCSKLEKFYTMAIDGGKKDEL